jgi:hypothetical protein
MDNTCRYTRQSLLAGFATILITFAAAASPMTADTTVPDDMPRKFFIGYDHGLSFRYQVNPRWAGGLSITSGNWGALFSASVAHHSRNAGIVYDSSEIYDIAVHLEALRLFKRWRMFSFKGFASFGAGYGNYSTTFDYYNSTTQAIEHLHDDQITLQYFTSAGILPCITFGIFTFEMRLGIQGAFERVSAPADSYTLTDRRRKTVSLIYPSDILTGIIIHAALF